MSGEYLACGYHGLKFDVNGRCVEVPGQTEVPAGAKVRSYPTHEKNNIVWIWMGDADKADPAKIPDLPWLSDPKWAATPGRLYVKTNYQFIIDNLLDLTHVAHVHKKTIAGDPREATTPTKTERLNDGVRVGRWMIDFVPPPLFAKAGNFTENVDRWQFVTWHPPGVVYLDVGCAKAGTGAPQGDRSQGISIWSSHLITPETEHTSHYMFGFSRDFKTRRSRRCRSCCSKARARPSWRTWNFSKRCRPTSAARSTASSISPPTPRSFRRGGC